MEPNNDLVEAIPVLREWPKMPSRLAQSLRAFTPLAKRTRLLFVGPRGTGKSRAAAILAGDLEAPLFRIDLSAVISKYIGETEKNLGDLVRQVDQDGPTVLLLTHGEALEEIQMTVHDLLQKVGWFPGAVIVAMEGTAPEAPGGWTGIVKFA
jgi:AAA+ superfamily predicted ATPase